MVRGFILKSILSCVVTKIESYQLDGIADDAPMPLCDLSHHLLLSFYYVIPNVKYTMPDV